MNDNVNMHGTNSDSPDAIAGAHAMDRIAKRAHIGIDAASNAAHPTIDRAAAGAHKAVDNADEMVSHAVEAIERAGIKGEEMIAAGSTYMREHPIITLGLAVGTGYVLSRLLASR